MNGMTQVKRYGIGWPARLLAFLLCAMLCVAAPWPARAAGGLEMSTDYTGMRVGAGDELTFNLDFDNQSGAGGAVSLSLTSLPEGWTGYFEGNGSEISGVYLKSGVSEDLVVLHLTVPAEATQGDYSVTLQAAGDTMSSSLTMRFTVDEEELGGSALSTEYAEQEGASGTSFTFSTTVQNNTASEQTYSFSSSAPSGWLVSFKPSGEETQVSSVTVAARSSQAMEITVTPPSNAEAGEYTIPISAVSASETLSQDLTAVITGSYVLELSTPNDLLSFDAVANQTSTVSLTLTNTGNVALQNITLSSSAPDGWTVEFSESTVDALEAGASCELTAKVTPAEDALSGDYVMTLSAETSEAEDSAEFRVTVKTETLWGVVGVLLIVAVCVGLWFVFRKYGRR